MPGGSTPKHDPLMDLAAPTDRLAAQLLSARREEQRPLAHAPTADEMNRPRERVAQADFFDSRATEFVAESEAMEKIAHMSYKMDSLQSQLQALRKENHQLQKESSRPPKPAGAIGVEPTAQEFKITIRLDDAENLPTSASLWEEGHDWQSALELCATLSLTTKDGRVEETLSSETRRHGDRASWDQCFVLLADSSRHADVLLELLVPLPDGHGPPQKCGSLRLPLPELLARGAHQGWFSLCGGRGEPFRSAQGHQAAVHLKVEVEEREAARLRAQLAATKAELEYVRAQLPDELREEVQRVRRENMLLQATVRDVRQELEWAKETMKSHGRLGEAKLLSELAALQTQLRSAFVTQQALFQAPAEQSLFLLRAQAPAEQSQQLPRQLRSSQASRTQQQEEKEQGGEEGVGKARQRGGGSVQPQPQRASASGSVLIGSGLGVSTQGEVWGGEGREVLRVLVGACVDLRVTKPGPCNPYCVLVLGRNRKTSHVCEDTMDPIFDASFEFDCGPASRGRNLTITVLSQRAAPSVLGDSPQDLRVGTAVLAVDAVREAPGMTLDAWLPIAPTLNAPGLSQTAGALHLQATLLPAAPRISPRGLPTSTRL